MAASVVVLDTDIKGLKVFKKGKVREVYELDQNDQLLMIATDRISAFDSVLPQGIPYKGKILTQISVFWFKQTSSLVSNHLIEHRFSKFPEKLKSYKDIIEKRS